MEAERVLIVEDEPKVADFIQRALSEAGYEPSIAKDYEAAAEMWAPDKVDLIILDLMIPGGDGIELLTSKRQSGDDTPTLIVSAKGSMSERVIGLDAGSDDYLPKPFGIEELLARVRVLGRRKRFSDNAVITVGALKINSATRRVAVEDRNVFLSETEFRLIELLGQKKGTAVSKKEILTQVWCDPDRDDNVVEVYVRYLRSKLESHSGARLIHTVRGQGYVLSEDESGR